MDAEKKIYGKGKWIADGIFCVEQSKEGLKAFEEHADKRKKEKISLIQYDNQRVKIVDDEGKVFIGKVNDYIYPEDNEPEERESIVVDTDDGQVLEFYDVIIEEIEIIRQKVK